MATVCKANDKYLEVKRCAFMRLETGSDEGLI